MPRWTIESRKRQAEKIKRWQPWRTAGVRTAAGKAISSRNALRHGNYSAAALAERHRRKVEIKTLHGLLDQCDAYRRYAGRYSRVYALRNGKFFKISRRSAEFFKTWNELITFPQPVVPPDYSALRIEGVT